MKTQIIRLAWQYGLKITIKDSNNIIISRENDKQDIQLEVIEKDDLFIKVDTIERIKSTQAFENSLKSYFQVQKRNKFVTLSKDQIINDLLCSPFSNTVVASLVPDNLSCATILLYEESFDYPKYRQLKYTVLEGKASAHIKHENNKTKIVLVGVEEQINHIINQADLPKENINWGVLKEPITFGVTIENEEEYLKTKIKELKKSTVKRESEIRKLEKTYRSQLNSLSWKVTKPLRAITGIAKKAMRK